MEKQKMKKTAIVTGSSRGIGFAIAKQLGLDGYNIDNGRHRTAGKKPVRIGGAESRWNGMRLRPCGYREKRGPQKDS